MGSWARGIVGQFPFAERFGSYVLKKSSPIFMLHRVLPSGTACYDREMSTTPELLDGFFSWLTDSFEILPLEGVMRRKQARSSSQRAVCAVTFDDGWKDNYEFAFPLLQKYRIPATIFLATDFIGTARKFWQERLWQACSSLSAATDQVWVAERLWKSFPWCPRLAPSDLSFVNLRKKLMQRSSFDAEEFVSRLAELSGCKDSENTSAFLSWEEVRLMEKGGVSFGSHTVNHTLLTRTAPEVALREIKGSKERLEEELGHEIGCFSYPWGSVLEYTRRQVKEAGYRWAVITDKRPRIDAEDPYLFSRIAVSAPLLDGGEAKFDKAKSVVSLTSSVVRARRNHQNLSVKFGNDGLIRIAYVIDSIDGWDGGGTEAQLKHFLEVLDRRYFEPALFFLEPSKRLRAEDFSCAVHVAKKGQIPGTISLVLDLTRALRKFRPQIVQTFFKDGTRYGSLAAKFSGVPILVQSERNLGHWMTATDSVLQRGLHMASSTLQCNSRTIYDWLLKTSEKQPDKIDILPNYLDVKRFAPYRNENRAATRTQLGISRKGPIIVSVANLTPVKDPHCMVRAAIEVSRRLPEAFFILIGDGVLREELDKEIREHSIEDVVRLAGSQSDVAPLLGCADLGILTSLSEGSSNALLEYMGMGIPAVASDIPANRELVDGVFFKPGDHMELAERIVMLWESPAERSRLSAVYRERALQYGEAAFRERVQGFYVRMMAGDL